MKFDFLVSVQVFVIFLVTCRLRFGKSTLILLFITTITSRFLACNKSVSGKGKNNGKISDRGE